MGVVVERKTKGYPYRHELQSRPAEDKKKALEWVGDNGFVHQKSKQQQYFPTPTKLIHPNLRLREEDQTIQLRTSNCLRNIEREQQVTTYDYNFTGTGTA